MPELKSNVRSAVGQAAWKRMKHFDQVTDATLPQTSHHFLGMLAVDPAYQGKSYGTRLLE
ncbi:MAG: GNAT family N-acetyltransferase [Bacteroidetes bacterium]|nr:GNAT family N-acetyltransferase [Bacteroidota bacterium]